MFNVVLPLKLVSKS